jgi:hypothetical protein
MQGALRVLEQPGKPAVAINSVDNAGLFRGLLQRSDLRRFDSLMQARGAVAVEPLLALTSELAAR